MGKNMCGIVGQIKFNGEKPDEVLVRKMTEIITHRGPDGEGFYFGETAGLGMRRLRIIDLTTGDQPIYNEDRTVATVLNGEIYNYRRLREELEARGHKFYTRSDTEVIVHAYEEYGENFVTRLDGMFGLAVWDEKEKKLVLARDRAGEKPLYYASREGKELVFASELKAILAYGDIEREIDAEALHYFLVYGRVPSPYCIISGIKKLAPAEMLVAGGGGISVRKYWHLSFKDKLDLDEEQLKIRLVTELDKTVKKMMMSDVPLGAWLSGGVDSSAVVAMMTRHSSKPIETFSVGFAEEDYSELKYARMVAEAFGTNHHEFTIEPEVMAVIPRLVWHLDEPFGDYSIIPTFYVARATRKFVTVALSGDGGDEVFAGYEWYKAIRIAQKYKRLPRFMREIVYRLTKLLPDNDEREKLIRYVHKLKRLAETQRDSARDPLSIFLRMSTGFTPDLLDMEVYTDETRAVARNFDAYALRRRQTEEYDGDDSLEALLYSQFASLLPDMFFTKVDRCAMAVALETRAPLANHEFAEFAARIPFSFKLRGTTTKYIFKEAMRGILPDKIIDRHKKGFSLPLNRWARTGELKENIRNVLLDDSFLSRGYFRRDYIEKLLADHNEGRVNNIDKIWRLYMLGMWMNEFMVDKNTMS